MHKPLSLYGCFARHKTFNLQDSIKPTPRSSEDHHESLLSPVRSSRDTLTLQIHDPFRCGSCRGAARSIKIIREPSPCRARAGKAARPRGLATPFVQ